MTTAQLISLVESMTRDEKLAYRAALKVGQTPEQAAAAEAFVSRKNPCTATPPCTKTFRTTKYSGTHGTGGHTAG